MGVGVCQGGVVGGWVVGVGLAPLVWCRAVLWGGTLWVGMVQLVVLSHSTWSTSWQGGTFTRACR